MNTLIVATRKALLIYRRSADGWSLSAEAFPGVPCAYAFCDARNNTLWAALDHGHWGQKLHRSRDRGLSWEEVPAPSYPDGLEVRISGTQTKAATLENIWVMAPGGRDEPGRLYLGTNPGGLFTSRDGGDTWALVEGLWEHPSRKDWFGGGRDTPGIHSILVDPRDSLRLQVGISCAGVFETRDGGGTWTPQNAGVRCDFLPSPSAVVGHDPHFVAASRSDPDGLWQQNHCGIFRSRDGGASWDDCAPPGSVPYFGFPVAVSDTTPETAWVVPAISDQQRMAVGGRMRRLPDRRRWAELAGADRRAAPGALLRPGLPPRPRRRRGHPRHGQHQRQPVGQRRRRRQLAGPGPSPGPGLQRALRALSGPTGPAPGPPARTAGCCSAGCGRSGSPSPSWARCRRDR